MKLDSKALMGEHYRRERDKYPDLTFAQFEEACRGPWRFLKGEMLSGRLRSVRFRYFGVFRVYEGRARYMLETLADRLAKGHITRERHDRLKGMLEGHLGAGEGDKSTDDEK